MCLYTHIAVSRGGDPVNDDDECAAAETGVDRSVTATAR